MNGRLDQDRGNVADYMLGTIEGWDAFEVVRWHGKEEISRPYEFDITLRRAADKGPVDLDALVDTGATLRIASAHRWRTVHGILAEAEEIDRTRAFLYYRLLLVPPMWRMHHRRRCRTFVYRTIKETLSCVFENRAHCTAPPVAGLLALSGDIDPSDPHPDWHSFEEPHGRFLWRVADDRRLTNKDLHPFVAQYNESDFDFLTRWLAHEGIAYYFEHTPDSVVMVLTDSPGQRSAHETDREATLRGGSVAGAHKDQELVRWLRDARRMRSRVVTMREYDFRRAGQVFDAQIAHEGASPEAFGHFEFPAKDDRLADRLAAFPAERRLQRFETERLLRHGMSTLRTLLPGHTLKVTDGDGLRDDEEILIVRSETFATQHSMEGSLLASEPFGFHDAGQETGGYENRFQALPAGAPFRPAPPPCEREKIWGVQLATVWGPDGKTITANAESLTVVVKPPDVHCNAEGSVRIRIKWDRREEKDDQPASDWVRVCQPWAGKGYGCQFIPRVNDEVLVAFMNGDPDRPIIVGSVYNSQNTMPHPPDDALDKTRTGIKTQTTTVADATPPGFNELRFTDYFEQEEIYLQAERDFNELVKANHSTSVGGDQSNSVGGNQTNTVKGYRIHDITGDEVVHVHGNRQTNFDSNESHNVDVDRTTNIGSRDQLTTKIRVTHVTSDDTSIVEGNDVVQVIGTREVQVHGNHKAQTDANYHSTASANHTFDSTNMYVTQKGEFQVNASTLWLNVGGCSLRMSAGVVSISNGAGASLVLSGGHIMAIAGGAIQTISGGPTNLTASVINGAAGSIHLNG